MSYFLDLLFEDFYEIFDMVPKWGGGRGGGVTEGITRRKSSKFNSLHIKIVLFQVGTPDSSVPLCVIPRRCEGETQKHGSTCLLRVFLLLMV